MGNGIIIPGWKTAPFLRILFPFVLGIMVQYYLSLSIVVISSFGCVSLLCLTVILYLHISSRYRFRFIQGIFLQSLLVSVGTLITWSNDIRNAPEWFNKRYADNSSVIIKIDEPPIEKEKSIKAEATVEFIITDGTVVSGKIIVYFPKDSISRSRKYGDLLLTAKTFQRINDASNPGGFNYQQYAGFHQIYHTVYLTPEEYIVLPDKKINTLWQFVFTARDHILSTIRKYISSDKKILGIAEALLIGYKADLDKEVLLAYSNTGVVHIIAISGLHLGLIYAMLSWAFNWFPLNKSISLFRIFFIISFLWLFALLTGSSASVLRSALMFSCILLGDVFSRKTSIYNSIACSAFMLLCIDPYFLWDVGFQLSYIAVAGIVWLQQPIYRALYFKHAILRKFWSMVAVTIAAQIAAFPLCIYYFHQFPNFFLLSNLIAVPLSTVILFCGIFLICFSWIEILAHYTGLLMTYLIQLLNYLIYCFNRFPYSITENIYADIYTTSILYATVFTICWIFVHRSTLFIRYSLLGLLLFMCSHVYMKIKTGEQKKIVVYNVARSQAIDFISQNQYYFIGDSSVKSIIVSSRILFQVTGTDTFPDLRRYGNFWIFAGTRICLVDTAKTFMSIADPIPVEIMIISRNPKVKIKNLVSAIKPSIIIFDASNSLWKIAEWKKECSALLLPFHSVAEKGGFVFNIH